MKPLDKKDASLLFRLLNIWLFFVVILYILSNLPRWPLPILPWINVALYFLLFLLMVAIIKRDRYNRDIFIFLSIPFFLYSISIIKIIVGPSFLINNGYVSYLLDFLFSFCGTITFEFAIIYIVIKYLLPEKKAWIRYLITASVFLPVTFLNFAPYILNHMHIFSFGDDGLYYADMAARLLRNHGLTFAYMVVYAGFLYRTDRILGIYINLLMASLFVFLSLEMVQFTFFDRQLHLEIFSGIILTLNLIVMAGILAKKYLFTCSEYGRFYETLIENKFRMGKVKIQAYKSESNAILFKALKLYLSQRRVYLAFIGIVFVSSCIFFHFPTFYMLITTVLVGSLVLLLVYINALHRKREKHFAE